MKNQEIARAFSEIADLLELKGENPFRIRAYRRAAQNIESLSRDIAKLSEDELTAIPGIGKDLAGKIREFLSHGSMEALESLRQEVPPGLTGIMSVPGVGPRTARLLFERLNVRDVDELEALAREGRLQGLPGIRKKTEENILRGIEMLKRGRERQPLGKVLPVAEDIIEKLKGVSGIGKLRLAGSLRRWKETIKDIDILATSSEPQGMMNAFVRLPGVREVLLKGPTKSSVILGEGLQVDLRVVEEGSFGAALQYFTGSKAHNIRIREMAIKRGLKINEYGVFREEDGKRVGGEKEEDVYRLVGLPYIPPELREDSGEIEAAIEGRLPRLVTLEDIRGDLHVHSKWSDGSHDIEELVTAARELGYQYIAITDHSKGLGIAGGLTPEEVLEQKQEVDALNKKLRGFRVFTGAEVDIRSDGTLDLPDEVLKQLDFVVASIHSGFRQSSRQLTMRLVSAMKNPYVRVIAHPTGRIIGERDAYEIDMKEFMRVAKETKTALEINAYPMRLDLSDRHAREAKRLGIPIVVNTDTHIVTQFKYMRYGVAIARRGWLEPGDIINTLNLKDLERFINQGVSVKKP
ncbi:MAG: DNA polymerase/3'-5' exonuclease PolX [Nitrospirae bacterium]|nr:DNA polymerase/3'-5' exonuclease PolX [Nitrospirota bacterium]